MLTLKARLFLAVMPDPESATPGDVAYTIFKEWASSCLDKATFDYPSDESLRDDAFRTYMNDTEKLTAFAEACAEAHPEVDAKEVLKFVHKYVNMAPENP